MQIIPFHDGWRYAHLDQGDWQEVTLPHDAMLSEPRTEQSPGGTNTGWFACRDYEYEKTFEAPEDAAYLEFEGVYHKAQVFLDGEEKPAHHNGYFGFRVPITAGHHSLRVIARNADSPSSRWYSGAGIYRPVSLVCLPKEHILPESIQIKTLDYHTRTIRVSFATTGSDQVEVTALHEKAAGTDSVTLSIKEAGLWSPEEPNLITLTLRYHDDVQTIRYGIRTVEVDAQKGFCINGKRTLLLGACIHHDNGILGAAGYPFAERRKVMLLKKAGYNAIRSAHNPISKAMLDACDELGMMVLDEYADMWYIHKTRYDYAECLERSWHEDLRLMVEKDRNHPSVVMYSIGNEVSETAQRKGIELTESMTKRLHELDDRPVTCGINIFFNYLSSLGMGVYTDKKAEQAIAEKKKAKRKAVGSEFFNNLTGLLGADFMKFGATLHGSNVKTRDAFEKLDVAGYNYGIRRYKRDTRLYPHRVILGSETFISDAMIFYDLAQKTPALIGDFAWAGMDYLGEVGVGAWEYTDNAPSFDHGPGWLTAGVGAIDLIGTETAQMAYTQVAFGLSPVRIGVIPVCYSGQKHSPAAWRMTNAIESWAWNGMEGRKAVVEVYARGAWVALHLNQEKVGKKRLNAKGIARFSLPYRPGQLTAVVYDDTSKETARTTLFSAEEETVLQLMPEKKTVCKDELLYVRLRYTDPNGLLKPGERGEIMVKVQGGTLMGLGNACSYHERGYLTSMTDTYYGEAMAVIRPEGDVTVCASSPHGTAQICVPLVADDTAQLVFHPTGRLL